jgi:hypothetical protein
MTMTSTLWTRKKISLVLATVTVACAAVLLFAGLTPTKPAPAVSLGAEWQCSRTLFMTTCTKALQTKAGLQGSPRESLCSRRT